MAKWNRVFLVILALLPGLVMLPGTAAAAGTLAGTAITNYATGTYTDANSNTYAPVRTETVTTYVSQVGGVALTPTSATNSGSADTPVYYPITLTNTGNGDDSYTLNYTLSGVTGWTVDLYVDTNGDGALSPTELAAGPVSGAVDLAADAALHLLAVVTPSAGAADGDIGVLTGSATSTFDAAKTVSQTFTTTIKMAVVNLTKNASPTTPKPGDTVTYTLTYTNTGSAVAYNVVISDALPSGVTYSAGTVKLNEVAQSDAAVVSGSTITISLASIAAGATGTITFKVTVNAAVAAGTVIGNTASIAYNTTDNDDNTKVTNTSTSATVTVAQQSAVDVAPATLTTNQIPGDLNVHPFTVTNNSNGTDTYNLTSVGKYWTWTIYNDVNKDGKYDSGDTLVTNSNPGVDAIIDTGAMAAGTTKYFVATTTVTGTNGQIGQHTVTATSVKDPTISDTSIKYTNIQTPIVTMSKTVLPAGNQPPGTELTYTITVNNTGAATASTLFVTDMLSQYLEYVPQSIKVDDTAQTDADDGDWSRYDTGGHTVYVLIPTLTAQGSLAIIFKATIK